MRSRRAAAERNPLLQIAPVRQGDPGRDGECYRNGWAVALRQLLTNIRLHGGLRGRLALWLLRGVAERMDAKRRQLAAAAARERARV